MIKFSFKISLSFEILEKNGAVFSTGDMDFISAWIGIINEKKAKLITAGTKTIGKKIGIIIPINLFNILNIKM